MSDDQIKHLNELREIHSENLRILERQAASFGRQFVPPYIETQIDELRTEIANIDSQLGLDTEPVSSKPTRPTRLNRSEMTDGEKTKLIAILQQQPYWQEYLDRHDFMRNMLQGLPEGGRILESIDLKGGARETAERTVNVLFANSTHGLKQIATVVNKNASQVPEPAPRELRKMIEAGMNSEEIKAVCLALGANYENLGPTLTERSIDLITFAIRRSRYSELITIIREDYPHVLQLGD